MTPTTVTNIGVAMLTVADPEAAKDWYVQTLGWEVRADVAYGENGDSRWLEVAPPGSVARVALNPPMGPYAPGGGSIGVETPDVAAEYERLTALGIKADPPIDVPGAPKLFMAQDPDGNHIAVVEVPAR